MDNLKDKLTGAAKSLGKGAGGIADNLQSHAKEAWDSVQHGTGRAMDESSAFLRKNPLLTALAVFGLGLALGLSLNRRSQISSKKRRFRGTAA